MNTKVYQNGTYPRNNQIVVHAIDIEQIEENVYCYILDKVIANPDNDLLNIVLRIGGKYFEFGCCQRRLLFLPENMERAKSITADFSAFVNSEMRNNRPISIMYMKVYEVLGLDTTPLVRYREQKEATRIAENAVRKQKEEEKRLYKMEKERQRLAKARQEYIAGNAITGEDFVSICREDGFDIHIRTVGTLYNSVNSLNKSGTLRLQVRKGKAKPKTDGVHRLIKEYNSFLEKMN